MWGVMKGYITQGHVVVLNNYNSIRHNYRFILETGTFVYTYLSQIHNSCVEALLFKEVP